MKESWTVKYCPNNLEDVVAQGPAVKKISKWADKWESGRPEKAALLFYGPTGTGKSAAAVALAKEMGWDLIELNASDKRTKKEIERIPALAATMGTLTGERRLIVLDEADNVHGTADRGGYRAISDLLRDAQNPVILIGNDRYDIPKGIREKAKSVNFRRLRKDSIAKVLRKIARKEGIEAEPEALKALGEMANGDLRSAINDFQAIAEGKESVSTKNIISTVRDRKINIFEALGRLKRAKGFKAARKVLWDLDESPEDVIDWIEENIPKMFSNFPDLADAYEMLSRADIFLGRVRRRQAYGLWGYASDLMSAGIALSRKGEPGRGRYGYPSSRRIYGRAKRSRGIRDRIARKISENSHTSSREARKLYIPYLSVIFKNDREMTNRISEELELEKKEIKFLKKFGRS